MTGRGNDPIGITRAVLGKVHHFI